MSCSMHLLSMVMFAMLTILLQISLAKANVLGIVKHLHASMSECINSAFLGWSIFNKDQMCDDEIKQ